MLILDWEINQNGYINGFITFKKKKKKTVNKINKPNYSIKYSFKKFKITRLVQKLYFLKKNNTLTELK